MVKRGREFAPNSRGGKWFAHPDSAGSEVGSRETCTSTGIMLTQVKSAVPQALQIYPKWKSQQKSREYPNSVHDNKYEIKNNILLYGEIGVRPQPFEDSQVKSQIHLCHEGAESQPGEHISIFKSDYRYMEKQVTEPTSKRRFPHNHLIKSTQAAQAQEPDYFMWFARI
ncbi:testis-expressed protein 36 [Eucyclogobius newberryi]|uniref:testis-expressed protein 36 n=1 Tax=Eucyclogobius newberryi TaxID=166745 RepID=UPI003B58F29C